MPLNIVQGDTTKIQADAIVNSVNNGVLRNSVSVFGSTIGDAVVDHLHHACEKSGVGEIGKARVNHRDGSCACACSAFDI